MKEIETLLDEAIDMAGQLDWFDDSFLQSLKDQFDERGELSENQEAALMKIHAMLESKVGG